MGTKPRNLIVRLSSELSYENSKLAVLSYNIEPTILRIKIYDLYLKLHTKTYRNLYRKLYNDIFKWK
jgi:fido (protein-threonine AMPylation protein)